MKPKFEFDEPYYDDLPPEEKSCDELVLLLLRDAAGEANLLRKYNEREINRCAAKLINAGLLYGSVIDKDKCVWSRLTMRGRRYLLLL